jgi:glucosamine kinase
MIEYLIGVDGGGTGTRVRIARLDQRDGPAIAQGSSGPSGLGLGIERAWAAVQQAIAQAFANAGIPQPKPVRLAIGLGLAGVHNRQWAQAFVAHDPGYAALVLETDAFTTLMGAHGGAPGAIVAIGTGSVGEALYPDGTRREVGGWGFPSGDEAGGAWIGLRAMNHAQQVMDGRRASGPLAAAVITACGGGREAIQAWLAHATQTTFASLAPLVLQFADDPVARAILQAGGEEAAAITHALDPDGALPLVLCGGLGPAMRVWLPAALEARTRDPLGDSADGALRVIRHHLDLHAQQPVPGGQP